MYVCVYICMCLRAYKRACVLVNVCMCVCTLVCVRARLYLSQYVRVNFISRKFCGVLVVDVVFRFLVIIIGL